MTLRSLALLLVFAVIAGCVSADEVARTTSPDRSLDAIIIERNGGATTSFDYRVYIAGHKGSARSGIMVADLYGASRSDSAYGVNLRWRAGDSLWLEYQDAKDTAEVRHDVVINGRRVAVSLIPGIVDRTAPGGGMLYNLERSRLDSSASIRRQPNER